MIDYSESIKILKSKDVKKFNKVKELLIEASNSYYNTDTMILSGMEYDEIYRLYHDLTNEEIVGADPLSDNRTINVKHDYENLVGTLMKLFSFEEAEEFITDMYHNYDGFDPLTMLLSLKFDGNSVTIEYNSDGSVSKALTRGKNGKGKDLTSIFKNRKVIPDKNYGEFAIKYEAIITYENYDKICEMSDDDYANPRSLVSGVLGKLNAKEFEKYITLVPLKIKFRSFKSNKDYEDSHEFIKKFFGNDNYFTKYCNVFSAGGAKASISKLKEYYDKVNNDRFNLPFMIDGIVIEFLNKEYQSDLGYTPDGTMPKFSKALKLPYLEKTTTVTGMDFCVGNSGRITPRIHFDTINFNGTEHTKQQISNYKRFKELNVGIGSEILVQYRSDCLSYITKIENEHNRNIEPIEFIDTCPTCGGDLFLIENDKGIETLVECSNPECPSKIVGKLENFLIRMDMKGTKENTIQKLVDNHVLKDIISLYNVLDETYDTSVSIIGKKTTDNLVSAIINKEYFDYEILGSLSINNIGTENAKIICRNYSIQEVIDMFNDGTLYENVICLESFGSIQADHLIEGIKDNIEIIKFLMERGYKPLKDSIKSTGDSLVISFTGVRNKALQEKLELMGHKVTNSVSKKTNVLICADPNSNSLKMQNAKENGAEIISIQEALNRWM